MEEQIHDERSPLLASNFDGQELKWEIDSEHGSKVESEDQAHVLRNRVGFWLLGLSSHFGSTVMLSAAYDALYVQKGRVEDVCQRNASLNSPHHLVCNPTGTGVILLVYVLPEGVIKGLASMFFYKLSYNMKVLMCALSSAASLIIVAMAASSAKWIILFGVGLSTVGAGFGELSFLGLTSHFHKKYLSAYLSGSGANGIVGALSYLALRQAGLSLTVTLLLMLIIPASQMLSYHCLLSKPEQLNVWFVSSSSHELPDQEEEYSKHSSSAELWNQKLKRSWPLLKYIIPMAMLYFAAYLINQALFELTYFVDACHLVDVKEQYRWYQVLYRSGDFIGRSTISLFKVRQFWLLPTLQVMNLGLVLCQTLYHYLPPNVGLWIMFSLVLWEGIVTGLCYSNTFIRVTAEASDDDKEHNMVMVSNSNTIGVFTAAVLAIIAHNALCSLKISW